MRSLDGHRPGWWNTHPEAKLAAELAAANKKEVHTPEIAQQSVYDRRESYRHTPYATCREFLVFEVVRMNEPQYRIAEQERAFAVIEPPRHFVKVAPQKTPSGAEALSSRGLGRHG